MNSESQPDWYAETFGECPHGYIKPYCGQCAVAESEQQRQEREERRERKRHTDTIRAQSEAMFGREAEIDRLRKDRD